MSPESAPGDVAWTGVLVFVVTWALVSARRLSWLGLDRPAGALLGAVACVALGVLSPAEAIAAVDMRTLLLLLGVMGMGAFLAVDGVFEPAAARLVRWAGTPGRLVTGVVVVAGGAAAFVTNDAVCVLLAPALVRLVHRHRLPAVPFLLALATGANTGSAATLVGNPQNMLCASLGGLGYLDHLVLTLPGVALALVANAAVLRLLYRRSLAAATLQEGDGGAPEPLPARARVTVLVVGGTAAAFLLGGDLAFTAAGGLVVLMLVHRRDTRELWRHVDWAVLLFFAGLFVVVGGLVRSGLPARLFAAGLPDGTVGDPVALLGLSTVFLVGSNVVSNVPFILVVQDQLPQLADPRLGWELLAVVSTLAGNLTLLGSVANVIVAEAGRDVGGLGFLEHLRAGLPVTLVTTAVAVLGLVAMHALVG